MNMGSPWLFQFQFSLYVFPGTERKYMQVQVPYPATCPE
jgi:hypothetical protein